MTAPIKPIAAVDVSRAQLEARVRAEASAAKLRWLLDHPEAAATGQPATAGERAELRHLLHDADPDAATPAFPCLTPKETS